jgi:hypothetical protein
VGYFATPFDYSQIQRTSTTTITITITTTTTTSTPQSLKHFLLFLPSVLSSQGSSGQWQRSDCE